MLPYLFCGIMEVYTGVIRGLGYSVIPTIVSLVGSCGLRIVWIATLFRYMPNLNLLFSIYPISWIVTTFGHMITYKLIYNPKKLKIIP